MRKFTAPAFVAALALLLSLQPGAGAQANPLTPQAPGGTELDAKARSFLQALQSLQADALFSQLAPWRQAAADLARTRLNLAARNGELTWDALEPEVKQLDPSGKLGLSSVQDFAALSPGQLLALHFGLYRMAGDSKDTAMLAEQWFAVHRAIGLTEPSRDRDSLDSSWAYVLEAGGRVGFESISGFQIHVWCVADGREWHVVDAMIVHRGRPRAGVAEALRTLTDRSHATRRGGFVARAAEGEQLLSAHRNRARVAHAKTGQLPSKLTGELAEGGSGVTKDELEGKYYTVRDAIYLSGDLYGIVAEPKDTKDLWLLYFGNVLNPAEDFILQYDTKEELEAAVRAVSRGEKPAQTDHDDLKSPK